MALPLPQGLVPAEVAFLCEMELVTVVPRQRLDQIPLLAGSTPSLRPPRRADLPLWLALLLKKQRRANIVPPPWLTVDALKAILHHETKVSLLALTPPPPQPTTATSYGTVSDPFSTTTSSKSSILLSPPFLPSNTAAAPSPYLPYHFFELAELLLAHAPDDIRAASEVRSLLKDITEARAAKLRTAAAELNKEGGADGVLSLRGVGAMELSEVRGFVRGVVDGVRKIGASSEMQRREEEAERGSEADYGDEDDDMEL